MVASRFHYWPRSRPDNGRAAHRIILTYEAEAQSVTSDAIVKKILNAVPVP